MNKVATFFRDFILTSFLVPVGIFMIVFSLLVFPSVDRIQNFIKTDAIVTKTELEEEEYFDVTTETHYEATYRVWVKYIVDDIEYEEEYGIYTQYKEGDTVTICYNPDDPTDIAQPNGYVIPTIILVVGIGAIIGGVANIFVVMSKRRKLQEQEQSW